MTRFCWGIKIWSLWIFKVEEIATTESPIYDDEEEDEETNPSTTLASEIQEDEEVTFHKL